MTDLVCHEQTVYIDEFVFKHHNKVEYIKLDKPLTAIDNCCICLCDEVKCVETWCRHVICIECINRLPFEKTEMMIPDGANTLETTIFKCPICRQRCDMMSTIYGAPDLNEQFYKYYTFWRKQAVKSKLERKKRLQRSV